MPANIVPVRPPICGNTNGEINRPIARMTTHVLLVFEKLSREAVNRMDSFMGIIVDH